MSNDGFFTTEEKYKIAIGASWLLFLLWVMFLYPITVYSHLGYSFNESHPDIFMQSIFINLFFYTGIGSAIVGLIRFHKSKLGD